MKKLSLSESIIKRSFDFSVRLIELFYDMQPYERKVEELRKLPANTLGNDIAICLDAHNLRLVPNYESHDLKHVLLGYEMTPIDEIRMQAFMLGNKNYTLPCFAILIFGLIILPRQWKVFYKDFLRGRKSKSITSWSIENYSNLQTMELRSTLTKEHDNVSAFSIESITKFGAFSAIVAGALGMLFCLPFLFSSSMADLVGAGFPFVGGSILTIGGLMALSNLSKSKMERKCLNSASQ